MKSWLPRGGKKFKLFAFISYVCLLMLLAYSGAAAYRGHTIYSHIKANGTMMTEGLMQVHPVLGYGPTPDVSGLMMLKLPPDIAFAFDGERCRVAELGMDREEKAPVMLFLGGSFTLGEACSATETYPALVAKHFNGIERNRGFSAYGLSQMVLIAREVIPRTTPEYVFAQYSSWLVDRPMSHFAPTFGCKRPQPFFHRNLQGKASIHKPPYTGFQAQTPAARYRDTERGFGDMLSFVVNVSIPLYFNEDLRFLAYRTRSAMGLIPPAIDDHEAVLVAAYTELADICEKNGARLIVPILGTPKNKPLKRDVALLREMNGIKVVDCWMPLVNKLPDDAEATYMSRYAHYRGTPPRLVNKHPNNKAHAIIAASIIAEIESERGAQAGEGHTPNRAFEHEIF